MFVLCRHHLQHKLKHASEVWHFSIGMFLRRHFPTTFLAYEILLVDNIIVTDLDKCVSYFVGTLQLVPNVIRLLEIYFGTSHTSLPHHFSEWLLRGNVLFLQFLSKYYSLKVNPIFF